MDKIDKRYLRKGKTYEDIYGKERAELVKKKISPIGRKHSEETKRKISESHKGIIFSEEHRKNIGLSKLGKKSWRKGIKATPEQIIILKENRAKQIFPVNDSSIEIKIQQLLKILGIEFYTHSWVNEISNKYRCDILIPSSKTIIECDGCYWHGCLICKHNKELNESQLKQIQKDKERTIELKEKGFRVIRLWEHEIKEISLERFKEKIAT